MTHNQLVVLNEVIRVHNDVNQVNNGAPFEEHLFLADRLLYSAEQLSEDDTERKEHKIAEINDSDEPDYSLSGVVNTRGVIESRQKHSFGETFCESEES